jgi:hypothetical protein
MTGAKRCLKTRPRYSTHLPHQTSLPLSKPIQSHHHRNQQEDFAKLRLANNKANMMKRPDSKLGRPRNYSEEQVREAINLLVNNGFSSTGITAARVKEVLCAKFHVTGGIDPRTLENVVDVLKEEHAQVEARSLIAELPAEIEAALVEANHASTQVQRLLVARQVRLYKQMAARECQELRQDKVNANLRLRQLEDDKAQLDAEHTALVNETAGLKALTAQLTQERDAALADTVSLRQELDRARADLVRTQRELEGRVTLSEELRQFLRHTAAPGAGAAQSGESD